jgi:hypothetical protein
MKNYTTKEYKAIVEAFEKGEFPGEPVVRKYEHPIKRRTIQVSEKQIKDTRR